MTLAAAAATAVMSQPAARALAAPDDSLLERIGELYVKIAEELEALIDG